MPKINLNKREILTKIREHFVAQDALAWEGEYGGCKYRTSTDQKCAIGALIPDELYSPSFEGHSIYTINTLAKREFGELLFDPKLEPFLSYLQGLHDRAANIFKEDPAKALEYFLDDLDSFASYSHSEASLA